MRRWPFHTNKPIGSEGPRVTINGRQLTHQYKLIPAREAVLDINGSEQRASVKQGDPGALFQVTLPKGKAKIQGWFRDADGKDLCGAYYGLFTKLRNPG